MNLSEIRAAKLARAKTFAHLFKGGKTYQEIGDLFGLTRERVRQLISFAGVTRHEGGAAKNADKTALLRSSAIAEKRKERNSEFIDELGCTRQVAIEINGGKNVWGKGAASRAFLNQKRSAMRREIEWKFTFPDWWRVWQESGKWALRGRGQGYCMARWGDSGAYEPSNVYICTIGENFSHSYLVHPWHQRFKKPPRNHSQLSNLEHEAVSLRDQGVTYSQIAARLGVPVGSINWAVNHGRKKLLLNGSSLPASKNFATDEVQP